MIGFAAGAAKGSGRAFGSGKELERQAAKAVTEPPGGTVTAGKLAVGQAMRGLEAAA